MAEGMRPLFDASAYVLFEAIGDSEAEDFDGVGSAQQHVEQQAGTMQQPPGLAQRQHEQPSREAITPASRREEHHEPTETKAYASLAPLGLSCHDVRVSSRSGGSHEGTEGRAIEDSRRDGGMRASNEASISSELINTQVRRRNEVGLDLIAAVKGLHVLSPQQLTQLIRDSGNNIVQHIAEDGSHIQVDMEKIARYLPLHLIAVIMAWERDKATFKYLFCGVLLLHSMCDLASRVPKIEQILLDDVRVSEQLVNLVFYLVILLGAYRQDYQNITNDMILLHSALVAYTIKLLMVIVSPQYQDVARVLSAYYKVDIFMDATFSAVCIDVKYLQSKLSIEQTESSAGTPPLTAEENLNHLCQQCDSSLHFLQSLCQEKSFRDCIIKNKEVCGNGGALLLVQAVLNLKISPLYNNTSLYMASISRLKSKALSILLHLCEAECMSFLDEVASNPRSQNLAKSVALQVLKLLKQMFGIDSNTSKMSSEMVYSKGQLELNAMRLTDVLSDDSNYRQFVTLNFTEILAAIFLLPHGEFLSGWCSSNFPVCEDDGSLDIPRASYAHQRTSLLIKILANLHCFVPDVCQDEKDLFLHKFVRFIECSSTSDTEKTGTVGKNLCSLLSHAESLVPRFLNEEDLQLLRLFINQFDSSVVSTAVEALSFQDARNTGPRSSPFQIEVASSHGNNDFNMQEATVDTVISGDKGHSGIGPNGNKQCTLGESKSWMMDQAKKPNGPHINLKEIEMDSSPTRGKTSVERMDIYLDDEKANATHSDENQQRNRKRILMNDMQVALIESALLDEPNMHRNSDSLKSWAEKLSLYGAEVTISRLKNWLNNRKSKLARAAKDVREPYEGERSLERQGSWAAVHSDSPLGPIEDSRVQLKSRWSTKNEPTDNPFSADAASPFP
ncbi:Unknown protein [Striga hermonthica]|uniref:Homeobox domain-containing protein n=1 Tax=Striga hermonthica TaxID=68872 RepID=A0A9N7ND47_STRHE|nr:Unknown protein [Striga hermonthica]